MEKEKLWESFVPESHKKIIMENNLIISPSPHIHSGDSVSKNMYGVLIALLPALLVSLYYFGLGALIVTTVSIASCVLFEYLIQRFYLNKKPPSQMVRL
jgi:electron transport complex protein RnfD